MCRPAPSLLMGEFLPDTSLGRRACCKGTGRVAREERCGQAQTPVTTCTSGAWLTTSRSTVSNQLPDWAFTAPGDQINSPRT